MEDRPRVATIAAGTVLADRYELHEPLGSGGMAQVWAATDRLLSRRVAVKVLHPHLADDPAFVQRFRREAVAAARLVHPSIVAVYDTISAPGAEAIVMELVEGTTLREVLDQHGPLPEAEVRRIGSDLAGALDCAHRNGIVHRDIKPANILLGARGPVRLTDFGIAKADEDPDLTVAGSLVGTAAYLAPEQVGGGRVDQRTDLYSLGTVLYEAATGQVPFRGDSPASTALARLHQDPAPLDPRNSHLSPSFCRTVMRNLERAPERRFQSALDFAAALGATGRPSASAPPGRDDEATDPTPTVVARDGQRRPEPPRRETPPTEAVQTAAVQAAAVQSEVPRRRAVSTPRRRRPLAGPLILLILVAVPVAIVAGLLHEGAGTGSGPDVTAAPSIEPVAISSIAAYDPFGRDGENDGRAAAMIDGDPDTAWNTEGYDSQTFGTKPGVGFVLRLPEATDPVGLRIVGSTGWRGRAWVLATDPAAEATPPETGGVAVTASTATTNVRLRGTGTYVLVWITDLGPAPTGRHRVSIAEVTVTARSGG